MSGRKPSRWSRIAGGEIGVAAEAADGDPLYFLDAFDALFAVNPIVHGIAEAAEHDQVKPGRGNHHLGRKHADLGVAGMSKPRRRRKRLE